MAYKILIPQPIAEEGKDYLRKRGYEIKMGAGHTVAIMKEDVKGCDAILMRTAQLPAEVLQAENRSMGPIRLCVLTSPWLWHAM